MRIDTLKRPLQFGWLLATLLFAPIAATAAQTELLVQKQQFTLKKFRTQNGKTIKNVKVGWESYGKLNADKSNVILITHYFSGTSHAAGKYQQTDAASGYWDAIIGPGKAIDTNKFYVVSMDTLVNANVKDPNVITTGPASINPDTGAPYGLTFPVVTITDFVEVQKAFLASKGIDTLYAVIGPSMGSFQAIEWASRYPAKVQRLIAAIGTAHMDSWSAVRLERWAEPIKADPNWQQGNYYGKKNQPEEGLITALAYITQDASNPVGFNQKYPEPALDKDAHLDIQKDLTAWQQLRKVAAARAALQDANHILYLVRASQLWRVGMQDNWQQALGKITAKTLFLPASGDLLLTPDMSTKSQQLLQQAGNKAQLHEIQGNWGHLDGLLNIGSVAGEISAFLQP